MSGYAFNIIAVGKVRSGPLRALCDEYRKRLSRYSAIDIVEIRDGGIDRESADIAKRLKSSSVNIALTRRGRGMSSTHFAQWIDGHALQGRSSFVFAIGGPDGLGTAVVERADLELSLSKMTLTHEMARVMLLEQIYRAMTILRCEPYHRG